MNINSKSATEEHTHWQTGNCDRKHTSDDNRNPRLESGDHLRQKKSIKSYRSAKQTNNIIKIILKHKTTQII